MAGVEVVGGLLDGDRADVVGQQRVEGAQARELRGVEGADLAERVDAGVRATRDRQPDGRAEQGLQRARDFTGDRPLAGLSRPAGEAAAVVFEEESSSQTSSR